jgi:CubicO group peptidase (beta-lactamase class C family)
MLFAVLLATVPAAGVAQVDPALTPDGGQQPGPPEGPADNAVTRLRAALADLDAQRARTDLPAPVRAKLDKARAQVDKARVAFLALDSALPKVVAGIAGALKGFHATGRLSADGPLLDTLARHETQLADLARSLAVGVLGVARSAGVDAGALARADANVAAGDAALGLGDTPGAAKLFKKVLPLKNALVFDAALFESRLRARLDAQTTGYAAAVNQNGKLVRSWGAGNRLDAFDTTPAPPVPFTTTDELNVASVTKTITATTVLELLQARGIAIDDPIGPYLPWDWARPASAGDVVDPGTLTFRQLMTHRSGLGGTDGNGNRTSCGMAFSSLKSCIAAGARLSRQSFFYDNGNFALFRVMMVNLIGGCNDPDDGCLPLEDLATAQVYRQRVQCTILWRMGLSDGVIQQPDADCSGPGLDPDPAEAPATPFHWFPLPNVGSVPPTSWLLSAGGGGWYFNALEMAQFLAHLRYDGKILQPATRQLMYENFLGWMDPANYGGMGAGVFGTYRMHGGDLCYAAAPQPGVSVCAASVQPRGVDTCIADFPTGVQAVVLINSAGGAYNYQCAELQAAHDASWVKK